MTKPDDNEPVTRLWFLERKCLPGRFFVECQNELTLFVLSSGKVCISVPGRSFETNVTTRGQCRLLLEILTLKKE